MHAPRRAFSLIELSVVLVIVGLLVGGAIAGQSLIRGSKLRSILTDFSRFQSATNNFQEEFYALPGDMGNATSFWGSAASGTTCYSTASAGAETCDGDGNGQIYYTSTTNETFRFWQHLSNAGLLEGKYDGIPHPVSIWNAANKDNTPAGRINGTGWWPYYRGTVSASSMYNGDYDNALHFGAYTANNTPATVVLTPAEAYELDRKGDDGLPGRGKIIGNPAVGCGTGASGADLTAAYKLTTTVAACTLVFPKAFTSSAGN